MTHWRSPTNSSLREFAEAPDAYLDPFPGNRIVDGARFYASIRPGKWIGVSRLAFEAADAAAVFAEVRALDPSAPTSWMTPRADLADALRAAGARDPEPPLLPTFTALATDTPPPAVDDVEVRRIETYEDHLVGLEIEHSSNFSDEARERRRRDARELWERRNQRAGGQWLAFVDGEAVAWGSAVAGPRGLYLAGGATLPEARGRGAYRALVRARWDDAVARGTPALVVGAQESSRPILERLGFTRVCTMYEVETGA